ncbi:hypothetical protein ACXIHB_04970 [Tenacibaculum sp. IMCC1]
MRNVLLIFTLFFSLTKVNAQSLEKIKAQNAFFILFNHKDKLGKFGCGKNEKFDHCGYYFHKTNGAPFKYDFSYDNYRHIDDFNNDMNKSMLFRIDKSFLRKNKDIIITREFMEQMGIAAMLDLLYSDSTNKTIFLINTADTKDGKILVREVTIDYTADE